MTARGLQWKALLAAGQQRLEAAGIDEAANKLQ